MRTKNFFRNERGFALLNVIFLTVITSFAAMILLNAATQAKNPQSILQLTALHVANEQFAQLESLAAADELEAGSYPFKGLDEDLTTENFGEGSPVTFNVDTEVSNGGGNLRKVTVTVSWTVGEKNFEIESERTVRVVKKSSTQDDESEETP